MACFWAVFRAFPVAVVNPAPALLSCVFGAVLRLVRAVARFAWGCCVYRCAVSRVLSWIFRALRVSVGISSRRWFLRVFWAFLAVVRFQTGAPSFVAVFGEMGAG